MKKLVALFITLFITVYVYAHVGLDNPLGGESYDPGDVVIIEWNIQIPHDQDNWDLYFSSDGGETWESLATDLPVSQLSFSWTVPDVATIQARIKIVMDNVGSNYKRESANFSIGDFDPFTLIYPLGNENLLIGTTEEIAWVVNGNFPYDLWNLYFSQDDGTNWEPIVEGLAPSTLNFYWIVPSIITSKGRIKLEMKIGTTFYEKSSDIFTINEEPILALKNNKQKSKVSSAYPNPFTTSTTLTINLYRPSSISLAIYNTKGMLVYNKKTENLLSGLHNLSWDPFNFEEGVYYYKILTDDSSFNGKLIHSK